MKLSRPFVILFTNLGTHTFLFVLYLHLYVIITIHILSFPLSVLPFTYTRPIPYVGNQFYPAKHREIES